MRVWSRVTLVRFSPWTIFLSDNLQSIIVSLNGVNQRPKKAKTRWKLNLQEFCEDTVSPNLNKPNTIGINSPDQERMLLHFFGRPRPLLAATPGLVLVRSLDFCLHGWNWVFFLRTLSFRPFSSSPGSTKNEFSESSGSNTDLTDRTNASPGVAAKRGRGRPKKWSSILSWSGELIPIVFGLLRFGLTLPSQNSCRFNFHLVFAFFGLWFTPFRETMIDWRLSD